MQTLPVFTDFQSIAALRAPVGPESTATGSEGERLVAVAEQFSAVFTQMMLKSMRQASLGEGILDSQQSEFYRDLFDQQLALSLSSRDGVGFSGMLTDHLERVTGVSAGGGANAAGAVAAGAYDAVHRLADPRDPLSVQDRVRISESGAPVQDRPVVVDKSNTPGPTPATGAGPLERTDAMAASRRQQ